MRLNRLFCRLCECPVVDGGVSASKVDLEKFDDWCLHSLGTELADDLFEDDVFCNFCMWDAEQELSLSGGNSSQTWWPKQGEVDTCEGALKRGYLDGMLNPCWVKLEKIFVPDSDEKSKELESKEEDQLTLYRNCIYCEKQVTNTYLNYHVQKFHKDELIKCEVRKCATYFRSFEERKLHMENVHEKPAEQKIFPCVFCEKVFSGGTLYRQHMKIVHLDAQKCTFRGCFAYFLTRDELISHFTQMHKEEESAKKFKCQTCNFKTSTKPKLNNHMSSYHSTKTIKCGKCPKMFASEDILKAHFRRFHTFKKCKLCHKNLIVNKFRYHFWSLLCNRCKSTFPCSGKLEEHKKICKKTVFQCERCPKKFKKQSDFNYHMRTCHSESAVHLKYKALGHKCEKCNRFYKSSNALNTHVNNVHVVRKFLFCEHCSKKYQWKFSLINHLALEHNLIECKYDNYKCSLCVKHFSFSGSLKRHMLRFHSSMANEHRKCRVCGNINKASNVARHMLIIHGIREKH